MSNIRIHELAQSFDVKDFDVSIDVGIFFLASDFRSIYLARKLAKKTNKGIFYVDSNTYDKYILNKASINKFLKKTPEFEVRSWQNINTEYNYLNKIIAADYSSAPVSVFLDTSSMPRTLIASLFTYLKDNLQSGKKIRLSIGYVLAQYTIPDSNDAPPNKKVSAVNAEFAGWPSAPGLPVKLIVGLGYENGKALGAVEYIQPSSWQLFIPDSPEVKFREQVEEKNKELIADREVYSYDVLDPAGQYLSLCSMLTNDVENTKPVLLPFGPKIFFAACLLCAIRFSQVAVWHVSGEEEERGSPKRPTSKVVFFSLTLERFAKTS